MIILTERSSNRFLSSFSDHFLVITSFHIVSACPQSLTLDATYRSQNLPILHHGSHYTAPPLILQILRIRHDTPRSCVSGLCDYIRLFGTTLSFRVTPFAAPIFQTPALSFSLEDVIEWRSYNWEMPSSEIPHRCMVWMMIPGSELLLVIKCKQCCSSGGV
jgi:hypothetical protein